MILIKAKITPTKLNRSSIFISDRNITGVKTIKAKMKPLTGSNLIPINPAVIQKNLTKNKIYAIHKLPCYSIIDVSVIFANILPTDFLTISPNYISSLVISSATSNKKNADLFIIFFFKL